MAADGRHYDLPNDLFMGGALDRAQPLCRSVQEADRLG